MKKFFILFILLALSCTTDKSKLEKYNNLINQANKFYSENLYLQALDYYKKAEKLSKIKDGVILYNIAFCYDKGEKNIKKAKKYYLKSLKYLKTDSDLNLIAASYFNLAIISEKELDFSKKYDYMASAYSILNKLETMNKANGLDYFRLAYYYMERKEFEIAIKYYEKSIEKLEKENPSHFYHAGAYFNIGKIYWDFNNYKKASQYWKKALELEPSNQYYLEWYNKSLNM